MTPATRLIDAVRSRSWWADLIERVAKTLVAVYAAAWVAQGMTVEVLWTVETANALAVAAVATVLMALGASQVGDPTTASFRRHPAN